MARLFDEHIRRSVQCLDGAWKFRTDPQDIGVQERWFCRLPDADTVVVPSVWNTEKGLLSYEGAAWYEKKFFARGGCLRFCFGAVMTLAKVWLDGKELGSHYGGFSQFEFLVPEVPEGWHTLTVRADNRFDAHSIPQKRVDWYHYGGIVRSVSVETLDGICVLSNRMEYTLSDDLRKADGRFILQCYNADDMERTTKLSVSLGSEQVFSGEITLPGRTHQEIILPVFHLDHIRLWDLGKPELYEVRICTDTDDLFDRVGFRHICVENGKILLNGAPIEIRGINRHEEHPDFGFAFPASLMKRDLDLVVDLNCNAIRGAHYPQSREFVDYLDEKGILFWSEIPIWGGGFSQEALGDELVLARGMNMLREMVGAYYNHPSILMWGMHNEILTDTPEAISMSQKYYEYLKGNGGNRLVVYATAQPMNDLCLKYTDVICINKYFGWYEGDMTVWKSFLDAFCQHRAELQSEDKPLIISEFGAAAIYGVHDTELTKWSEEYQAAVLRHCLNLFRDRSEVAGAFVWQFCDIRTCPEMGFSRGRGFNNKGILNEHRRPKAAYYAVQECYRSWAEKESQ